MTDSHHNVPFNVMFLRLISMSIQKEVNVGEIRVIIERGWNGD